DDVLSAVPPELSDFLIQTSVLDELSGPVCDAVLEQPGSALALARLADSSQLLVPLDRAHGSYRWQRLFGHALKTEPRRVQPEIEPALQKRASAWYAARGDIHLAIEHAVAAGDATRAGEMLWANVLDYVARGRSHKVQRWLSSFSSDAIADSPQLALC